MTELRNSVEDAAAVEWSQAGRLHEHGLSRLNGGRLVGCESERASEQAGPESPGPQEQLSMPSKHASEPCASQPRHVY